MLYKVYVNLCDFKGGSYVTLGTRATQGVLVHHQNIFEKKSPFWTLSGARPCVTLGTSFEQT